MRRLAALAVGLSLIVAAPVSHAQRQVVIRAPSRAFSLACTAALGGQSWSFSLDEWYAIARASLLDPANFGPSGTVHVQFTFGPPYDSFDPQRLDGADVLVLNPYSATPQGSELRVFGTYARGGVGFVSFQNAAATYFASAGACAPDNTATFASAAGDPVLAGPFGTVSSPYFTGFNCSFTAPDPLAAVVSNNDVGPNALRIDLSTRYPGAARTVSFGDEEHFGGLSVPGCGSGGLARGNNNDVLLRNVFAWVAATAHDPIPSSVEGTGDEDGDGVSDDLDGDDDGDGILDLFEAGDTDPATPPVDTDHDGTPDYRDTDSDGDGIDDSLESGAAILDPPVDTDGDGVPDFQDTDSDGDGVPDQIEGVRDIDGDGVPNYRDTDSDGDGVLDGTDNCRLVPNAGQEDANHNGIGDACEMPDAGPATDSGAGDASDASDATSDAVFAMDVATRDAVNDGSTSMDASGDTGSGAGSHGGCGCRAVGDGDGARGMLAIVLLAGAVATGSRRRRRTE